MKNTLAAYGAQSAFPFAVVVDNHSTDGTAEILRRVGLCDKDFFIYYDDTEHSYRVSRAGRILCFPELRIDHDLKKNTVDENSGSVDWRFYYKERNWYVILKRHFPRQFKFLWTRELRTGMGVSSI